MAERFDNNKPVVEKTTVVSREGAENGAREYKAPEKKGAFPWWLIPLALIPLLIFAFSRRDNNDTSQASSASMAPVAMASPLTSPSPMAEASPMAVTSPAPDMSAADAMDRAAATQGAGATSSMVGAEMADTASDGTSAGMAPSGKDIKVYKGNDIAVAPKAGASNAGEPLSDVVAFAAAPDKTVLIDRNVSLKNVPVVSVINSRAFYVGPSASQEMLVMLGPNMAATGKKNVVIKAGDKVSLTGILKPLPEQTALQSDYQIGAGQYSSLQNESVYLHATIAQEK